MRSLQTCLCFSLLLAGCGSSGAKPPEEPKPATVVDAAVPEESPEQKFARQQTDTLNKMCQRLIDCSIEDARQSLTPEKFAELKPEALAPKAIAECTTEADRSPLSPRQVVGIRTCLGVPSDCTAFGECIGSAGNPK